MRTYEKIRVLEEAACMVEQEKGTVFTDPAPLRSRLHSIFRPTHSLRVMAQVTRRQVGREIREYAETLRQNRWDSDSE